MRHRNFEIEAHSTAATLYVTGHLWLEDEETLRICCSMLPGDVQWLRIDARGLDAADFETRAVLRGVMRHWRDERSGGLMLYATERFLLANEWTHHRSVRRELCHRAAGGAA